MSSSERGICWQHQIDLQQTHKKKIWPPIKKFKKLLENGNETFQNSLSEKSTIHGLVEKIRVGASQICCIFSSSRCTANRLLYKLMKVVPGSTRYCILRLQDIKVTFKIILDNSLKYITLQVYIGLVYQLVCKISIKSGYYGIMIRMISKLALI